MAFRNGTMIDWLNSEVKGISVLQSEVTLPDFFEGEEVRDREKVMRGLKKDDTVVLKGYQLYHNYFRPHEALDGKTPSEACGITIEGQNKWKTLIQNTSRKQNP